MSKPIVLFGAAEIAEVALFYFTHDSDRQVVAATVDAEYLKGESFHGHPLVAFEEVEVAFPPEEYDVFVALSYSSLNRHRAKKCEEAQAKGYKLAFYVSSKATVWPGLDVRPNCFILEDNTIQPFVQIGNNVTLWSGNHVGHHAVIEEDCFVSSHVVISGGVRIGRGSFIGVNATLRDHIVVGQYSVVGAGALLLDDAPDHSVFRSTATERSKVPSTRLRGI